MKLVITNNVHSPKPRNMKTRDAGLRTCFAYAGVAEAMRSTVGFGFSRSANVADHGCNIWGSLARQVCSPSINDGRRGLTGLFTIVGMAPTLPGNAWPGVFLARNGSHRRRYPSQALSWLLHALSAAVATIWSVFPGPRGLLRSSPFNSSRDQVFDQKWWIIVGPKIIIKWPNHSWFRIITILWLKYMLRNWPGFQVCGVLGFWG